MFSLGKMAGSVLRDFGGLSTQFADAVGKALTGQQHLNVSISDVVAVVGEKLDADEIKMVQLRDAVLRAKYVEILQSALEEATQKGSPPAKQQVRRVADRLTGLANQVAALERMRVESRRRMIESQSGARSLYSNLGDGIH